MKNLMKYKGFYGSVILDNEELIFHGKLEFINALVTYEAVDAIGIKKSFKETVDDYLELCQSNNIEPEKPCKGSLNVRIGETLHMEAAAFADKKHLSINDFIKRAIQHEIENDKEYEPIQGY